MTDPRPADCRFRLQDEGKAYPRSSCTACRRSVTQGLGKRCHHVGWPLVAQATPARPPEPTLSEIAMEVGKQVVHHIATIHCNVVATRSAHLSVRNCTHNAVMAATLAAEEGRAAEWIRNNEKHRRKINRYRKAGDGFAAGTYTREQVLEEIMIDREAAAQEIIPPDSED